MKELIATSYRFRDEINSRKIDSVSFDLMASPFYFGYRWAVRKTGSCLAKDGEWEYEPIPSSRDDEFYKRCRFDSLEDAIAAYNKQLANQTDET